VTLGPPRCSGPRGAHQAHRAHRQVGDGSGGCCAGCSRQCGESALSVGRELGGELVDAEERPPDRLLWAVNTFGEARSATRKSRAGRYNSDIFRRPLLQARRAGRACPYVSGTHRAAFAGLPTLQVVGQRSRLGACLEQCWERRACDAATEAHADARSVGHVPAGAAGVDGAPYMCGGGARRSWRAYSSRPCRCCGCWSGWARRASCGCCGRPWPPCARPC